MDKLIISDSVEKTEEAGYSFAENIKNIIGKAPVFICMFGELGAGKTAFIRGIARFLTPNENVKSPTYSLINLYTDSNNNIKIYHMDLYRLGKDCDINSIGYEDIFYENNALCIIEWSEFLPCGIIPNPYYKVEIKGSGYDERIIDITEVN